MEFKRCKFPSVENRRGESEAAGSNIGSLTPRNMLSTINKTMADRQLDCRAKANVAPASLGSLCGYEIDATSRAMFFPTSGQPVTSVIPSGACEEPRFGINNDGLNRVYTRLSKLELEPAATRRSLYMMPKRTPRKPPRKPFDVSAYAKRFMYSVADAPRLRRSRTNVTKDFALSRKDPASGNESDRRIPGSYLKATAISDLLQMSAMDKPLPGPATSPSEQGKMLLPAMRPKVRKIKAGDPCFMNRIVSKVETLPGRFSPQTFRMTRGNSPNTIARSTSQFAQANGDSLIFQNFSTDRLRQQDSKWTYMKIANSSIPTYSKLSMVDPLSDLTKAYCEAAEQNIQRKTTEDTSYITEDTVATEEKDQDTSQGSEAVITPVESNADAEMSSKDADSSMDVSQTSKQSDRTSKSLSEEEYYSAREDLHKKALGSSKDDGLKFSKRRKPDPLKNRLQKAQISDANTQNLPETRLGRTRQSLPKLLPPISTSDLLVAPCNQTSSSSLFSLTSLSSRRRGATDADDELERSERNLHDRPKRYRKQPQYYSSGSEAEELGQEKGAVQGGRRKKRKKIKAGKRKENSNSRATLRQSKHCIDDNAEIQNEGENSNISTTSPAGLKGRMLKNTTSESIISRYITDLSRRGHIIESDPEDGDDEQEDDDYDISNASRT